MRRVLLTAAFLLLTALGAAADDKGPPKDAKDLSERLKLKRMREAILAEVREKQREKQRKKLLAVYRGKPDFHACWRIVHDHKTGEEDYKTHYYLSLLSEKGSTIAHLGATEAAKEPINAVSVLSPERFVLHLSKEGPPVVGRGQAFTQARSDRINTVIAKINAARKLGIRPLKAMHRSLELTVTDPEAPRPRFHFSLGMETGSGEMPSWLEPDFWKQRRLSGEGTAQVKLDRDGVTCWIDRATGLIELLRTRYADGSGWSWLRRLTWSPVPLASLRTRLKQYTELPLTDEGLTLDGNARLLALRLLLHNVVTASAYDPAATWPTATAELLAKAVFEDAVADDELSALIRWGAAHVEAMRGAAPGRPADELRGMVLRDMQERLFQRWWEPIERLKGVLSPDDPIQLQVPPSDAPLMIALRTAIRAYVRERVAAAWAD